MSNLYLDSEFIPMDIEKLIKERPDIDEYRSGVKIGSFLAGIAAPLLNAGLSTDNVTEIIREYLMGYDENGSD